MAIRQGSKGSKEEGGARHSGGEGAKVKFVKNVGTADPSVGAVPAPQTSKSGLNKELGK